jgi:hypothetical protein
MIHGRSASGDSTMLTEMTEEMTEGNWALVLRVVAASCFRRDAKGRNDRCFLKALHYFTVHTSLGGTDRRASATGTRCGNGSGA